ncbi:MAG: NDP-sugar synthase [Acidimicrobiia bacterium]|nr:NDP-sugar synthase [Acidimicrobiia bacterium]
MRAIVLVGGFGTRLAPLTYTRPKPLLPLLDKPILEWAIGRLVTVGVDEVVLSLGYLPDAFRYAYPDGVCCGARLIYAVEPEPLDTAGAVRFAALAAGLERSSEPFFVLNGDVFTDADPARLLALHRDRRAEATLALTEVDDPSRYGVVSIDSDGRVEAFIEKPPAETAPTRWINAGTYVLEPSVIDRVEPDRRVSIEREVFPAIVAAGGCFALQDPAYWVDTGLPDTYLGVQRHLLGRHANAGPAGYAHGTASVDEAADVRSSVVMAGGRVDAGATVSGSVLLPGAHVHAGAQVLDSIVGAGSSVGDGAVVAELSVVGDGEAIAPRASLRRARVPDQPPAGFGGSTRAG